MILGPQYHGTEEDTFVLTKSFKQLQAQRPGDPEEEKPGEEHAPPYKEGEEYEDDEPEDDEPEPESEPVIPTEPVEQPADKPGD